MKNILISIGADNAVAEDLKDLQAYKARDAS